MADIWARVDEAIDTDPLQLRGIVAELLARAEQAEAAILEAYEAAEITTRAASNTRGLDHVSAMGRLTALGQLVQRLALDAPTEEATDGR